MIKYISIALFLLLCGGTSFYVPIARSGSISKIAKSIKLEDSTVVVSRNSTGYPVAFHDFCGHRGASFDNIVLEQDSITCPYHRFKFDVNYGYLTEGLGVKQRCASLRMVECLESNGIVWVCVDGDNQVPPPPEIEKESDTTFRKISGSVTIKCPVKYLVENIIDCTHLPLHSFGNEMDPEPISYKAQKVSDTHGVATFQYNAGKNSMFDGLLDVENWYYTPCTAGTMVTSGDRVKIVQVHAVQLANGKTKVFWDLYRNWAIHPIFDIIFDIAMKITLKEDQDILEKCNFDQGNLISGKYDKLQLFYRRALKKLS